MNDKTIELLSGLADKFGTTVDHLWGVLVKQAYVGAWATIVTLGGLIMFSAITIITTNKRARADFKNDAVSIASVAFVGACIAGSIGAIGIVGEAPELITCFLNPEYWALKQVLP